MLILHFDYPSAASAVAMIRLQQVADQGGAVRFAGVDILGLDVAIPPPLALLEEHDRWRDVAADLGLPLTRPTRRPVTARAHLVGHMADGLGLGAAWRSACLQAYWADGADLGDLAVLHTLAAGVGLDATAATGRAADPGALREQRRHAARLRRRGIGGVPVLEVDGTLAPADLPPGRLRELAAL